MKAILDELNPEQRRAVETLDGPLLVLAGAGSGKTRVITARIANLLHNGVPPESVLAVTFTNKAAAEMRSRVAELVGKERAERLFVGTFHAFCLDVLRENAEHLGLAGGIHIADASDQLAACKRVLRELHVPDAALTPPALQARISLLKNRLVTPEEAAAAPGDETDELVARGYERYQAFLERSRQLDFDDLLLRTLGLLRENEYVRGGLQRRFRYLLVDEYQDTNRPQNEIVRELAAEHKNLCVVGDDDQSIYSWRGADVGQLLDFEQHFPGATLVRLETNYRSTQEILDAANRVIKNNPARHEKELRAHAGRGELLQLVVHRDELAEAEYVVREITNRVDQGLGRLSDFAILFRTATQPRVLEAELRAREVPYVLIGGMSFFDRKEVRDVLAYLKLVYNADDEVSLLRVVNRPPRGVGKTTLERVTAFATAEGISVPAAFDRAGEIERLPPAALAAVERLRERLAALGKEKPRELGPFVERVVETFAYREEVERAYPDPRERQRRWQAVDEIIQLAESHSRRRKRPSLGTFLNELGLSSSDDRNKDEPGERNAVTLMTLHAAKGLEFPRVFLVGLEEGLLPHARAVAEDGVEEERRLVYVGITRARRGLTVSHTLERQRHGHRVQVHPSRFVFEMKGEEPPEGWVAAGTEAPPAKRKRATKRNARRRRRR